MYVDGLAYCEAIARVAAVEAGYKIVVEKSGRSEARYVYVERSDGVWYGFRLAAHRAVYECSKKLPELWGYEQFTERRTALQVGETVRQAVLCGGEVTSDPDKVYDVLYRERRLSRHGKKQQVTLKNGQRLTFQWEDLEYGPTSGRWNLVKVGRCKPTRNEKLRLSRYHPVGLPDHDLSPQDESNIRVRLHNEAQARVAYANYCNRQVANQP